MTTKPKPFTPSAARPIGPEHVGWTAVLRCGKRKVIDRNASGTEHPAALGGLLIYPHGQWNADGIAHRMDVLRVEPPGWGKRKRKKAKPDPAKAKPGEVWRTPGGVLCVKSSGTDHWWWATKDASGTFYENKIPEGSVRIAAAPKKGKK